MSGVPSTATGVTVSIPDLLWEPGWTIALVALSPETGDAWDFAAMAVEVYTENRLGQLVPAPTPTPPLT